MKRGPLAGLLMLAAAVPAQDQPPLPAAAAQPARPNVIVLIADDMSPRDVELVPTPNIDRLAAEGVSFTSMYADPVCSPTRVTLLMGEYAYREHIGTVVRAQGSHGLADADNPPLGFERLTLAELLKAGGYATLAVGKNHLANDIGGMQAEAMRIHGFDHNLASSQFTLPGNYYDWFRVDDGRATRCKEYNTTAIVRTIAEWWTATDGPKFCWGAFNAPHTPFQEPPAETLPPGFEVGRSDRAKYEATIMAMDHEIGVLLQTVDLADTLVVFLSDNGTPEPVAPPGVDPNHTKGSVFDAGVRVPFIMAGPGIARGAACDALTNTTDLYATLAERLGLPVPEGEAVDSVSMAPYLAHPDAASRRAWVYSEYWLPNGAGPKSMVRLMARNRTHKLMASDPDGDGPRTSHEALFRMEGEELVAPADFTDVDRAALDELRAVLADKGPPR